MPFTVDTFMTVFIAMTGTMVAVAMVFLLPPLLVPRGARQAGSLAQSNLAIYRQQMRELELDFASGTLALPQFEESKRELEQRVVAEIPSAQEPSRSIRVLSRRSALAVAVIVPVAAALLYGYLGSPQAIRTPPTAVTTDPHPTAHELSAEQIEGLASRLAARLETNPGDGTGWAMLARSYAALGRHADAIRAFGNAVALLPRDAQLLADYADAMAMARGGGLEGEPMKLVQQALKAEPTNVKALALAGTAAFNRKEFALAASYWERAVRNSAEDSEFTSTLRASLDEARALAPSASMADTSSAASGPTTMQRSAGSPVPEAHLAGRVTLAPELAERVSDDDTVFVFARATQGPRMPLAMIRARVKDLPLKFVLDDSTAMAPALNLSSADKVLVVARISRAGAADPRPGDIEGTAGPVRVGAEDVKVSIDRVLH